MLTNPPTILIIEDADIADPMANELRRLGYSVRTNSIRDGDEPEVIGLAPDDVVGTTVIQTDLIFYPWPSGEEERSARIRKFRRYLPELAIIFLYPVHYQGARLIPIIYEDIRTTSIVPEPWYSLMLEADHRYSEDSSVPKVRVAAWPFFFLKVKVFDTRITSPNVPARNTYGDKILLDLVPLG
jgi:hypothetical protein